MNSFNLSTFRLAAICAFKSAILCISVRVAEHFSCLPGSFNRSINSKIDDKRKE